jgi:hypothetical protein
VRVEGGASNSTGSSGKFDSTAEALAWMRTRMGQLRADGWQETARSTSRRECLLLLDGEPARCWVAELWLSPPGEPAEMFPGDASVLLHRESLYGVWAEDFFTTRFGTPDLAAHGLDHLAKDRRDAGWVLVDHDSLTWRRPRRAEAHAAPDPAT